MLLLIFIPKAKLYASNQSHALLVGFGTVLFVTMQLGFVGSP